MTTKPDFYGSDDDDNKFPGKDGMDYFTLVNKQTGEVEIYQESLIADKRVGNIDPKTGKVKYNGNWWGGANNSDKEWVNTNLNTIKDAARKTTKNGLAEEKGLRGDALEEQSNALLNNNKGFLYENALSQPANKQIEKAMAGPSEVGTREKPDSFGVHVFPQSLRLNRGGQDFMKIDMMAYQPRTLQEGIKKGTLGLSERPLDRATLGSVILPIPGAINDSQQVSWNQDAINPFQLAG